MPKLTKRFVEAAAIRKKPYLIFDQITPGFCIRILPSGRRSYYLQYMKNKTTKRFLLGQHGIVTTEQARDKSISKLAEIKSGGDPQLTKSDKRKEPVMSDIVKRFINEHMLVHCKAKTQEGYQYLLNKRLLPVFGKMKVSEVTRTDISAFHLSMQHIPYEANNSLMLISKIFTFAEVCGLRSVGTNPCKHVKRFSTKSRDRYLTKEEAERLGNVLNELKQHPNENLAAIYCIQLLMLTGCRLNEIQTLKWEYIDYENEFLRLPDSKTGAKVVYVGDAVINLLQEIKEHPRRPKESPYIIWGKNLGTCLNNVQKPWQRFRKLAGLDDVHIHDLRHSFASFAVNRGMSLPMIGRLLGHTQAQTTSRYAHLMAAPMKAAANSVTNELSQLLKMNTFTKSEKKEEVLPGIKIVTGTTIKAPTYLTSIQAAEYLNVNPRLMEHWRYKKTGPSFIKAYGRIRYKIEALEEFMNDKSQQSQLVEELA